MDPIQHLGAVQREQNLEEDVEFASSAEADAAEHGQDYDEELSEDILAAAQEANFEISREAENLVAYETEDPERVDSPPAVRPRGAGGKVTGVAAGSSCRQPAQGYGYLAWPQAQDALPAPSGAGGRSHEGQVGVIPAAADNHNPVSVTMKNNPSHLFSNPHTPRA